MVKEAFILSLLLGLVFMSLMGYLFMPSAHALRQPVIPKGAIEIKTCASTISAGDGIAETNYVPGDAACKYECYYQGDFCVRCSHDCINHPALVLNVWYWYEFCYVPVGNGKVAGEYACCNPLMEYCHEVCTQ